MRQNQTLRQPYAPGNMKIMSSRKPPKPKAIPSSISASALIVHFDGGYKQGVGAGGFLVWGPDGKCIGGKGLCYKDAETKMTHNVAELWAARDCLSYLQSEGLLSQHKAILIRGDS